MAQCCHAARLSTLDNAPSFGHLQPVSKIEKYGYRWTALPDDSPEDTTLRIEMDCIRRGIGMGLSFHYEQIRKMLWPELDDHRWHSLIRDTILANKCTVLAGPASTGKTHEAAWLFLCEYMIWPDDTCVLVSSTDIRGLRGRIWSEITSLWQKAKDKFPWIPGNLLDSRVAILTDALDEETFDRRARDYRKCIQGVPCRNSSGSWIGINRYAGWKQKRMRLVADEAGQMQSEYINGVTNLNANPDFKAVIMGNFDQPTDCLGRCAEPVDGWSNHIAPRKTEVWDTFYPLKGKCVNLIGFDSPNYDYPKKTKDDPDHFPYMLGPKRIEEIRASFGEESVQFMSMCWGAMKIATLSHRVLTRELCEKGHAFDEVDWDGPRTKVAFLDSAWGGDRCVFTWAEFGKAVDGKTVFRLNPPEIVPLGKEEGQDADYAIADWCKERCDGLGILPQNFGHDSTGRGSLGTALARLWSDQCNPVEFGTQPTDRPCGLDLYTYDPVERRRRPMLCSEHYVKFVSELWFSVHYAVEAGQVRNLSKDVMEEFCMRVWQRVKDDKIEVEPKSGTPTKPGMKQRTGRSPDLADSAAGCLEMARRKGFAINRLANEAASKQGYEWMRKLHDQHREFERKGQLVEV